MFRMTAAGLIITFAFLAFALILPVNAQQEPVNGMRPVDLRTHAIVGATVIPAPGKEIENATILIRSGVIEAVGTDLKVPADARVWDAEGLTVYAGLIDPAVLISGGELPASPERHWNANIRPERRILEAGSADDALRSGLRKLGFTAAAVYPDRGIFRGSGAVISLGEEPQHQRIYSERTAMGMGFDRGGGGGGGRGGGYPGSLMGSIALARQTLLDAEWHGRSNAVYAKHPDGNEPPAPNAALDALHDIITGRQRVLFDVSDENAALRAAKLADEFGLDVIFLGSGLEFRRLDAIKAIGAPIIVPLRFPDRPDVSTVSKAESATLRDLMTWEQAPTNVRRLKDAGVTIALTTERLRNRNEFAEAVRDAIKHGLNEDDALAAITTTPAQMLGLDAVMGTIEPGKLANLVVVDGVLIDKKAKIRDTWINGRRYEISAAPDKTIEMTGVMKTDAPGAKAGTGGRELKVEIDTGKSSFVFVLPPQSSESAAEAETDEERNEQDAEDAPADEPIAPIDPHDAETPDVDPAPPAAQLALKKTAGPKERKIKAKKTTVVGNQLTVLVDGRPFEVAGYVRLSGVITDDSMTGSGMMPDGSMFTFTVTPNPKEDAAVNDGTAADDAETDGAAETIQPDAAAEATEDDGVSGIWALSVSLAEMERSFPMDLTLKLEPDQSVTGTVRMGPREIDLEGATFDRASGQLRAEFQGMGGANTVFEGTIRDNALTGVMRSERGEAAITGTRTPPAPGGADSAADGDDDKDAKFEMPPDELNYPLGAYGISEPREPQHVLIAGATIWTSGPNGIINNGWIEISGGKITGIGSGGIGTSGNFDQIINARGKHITPGLIDCHSHTGIDGGVNEGGQANTAECRIGDVIDPDDINFYRQLAGGLTACNQLHGSANPIGGQNSVIKLKWGGVADDYAIDDAIPGIKFALGENVKRSQSRYPNTRMGVETFIRDAFTAAQHYEAEMKRSDSLPSEQRERTLPVRRDLELEALVEILNGERIVHCHSYRQDEILALIRIAEEFGFTIGTFQHVLEGYKVAEAIAAHGAGASSFSDWWAYKVEVMDAIPHNGTLMTDVGVVVSFNSDSDELARRMNTEASKAVRYGGLAPEEALKLVTINPAKQLRIDKRTGSLEVGKDADFVIWSGDPLSTYTRCEQTWIDGAPYFTLESDQEMRERANAERQRIMQKILVLAHGEPANDEKKTDQPNAGDDADRDAPSDRPGRRGRRGRPGLDLAAAQEGKVDPEARASADEFDLRTRAWIEDQLLRGRDPESNRPGECGCGHLHE